MTCDVCAADWSAGEECDPLARPDLIEARDLEQERRRWPRLWALWLTGRHLQSGYDLPENQ